MSGRTCQAGTIVIAVSLLAIAGLATVAMLIFWPATRTVPTRGGSAINVVPLRQALQPEALEPLLRDIAACGRRGLGSPGLNRTADLIAAIAREAGAELMELPVRSPRPMTRIASLVPLAGATPAGLAIYPFKPNLVQPGSTPRGGLVGKLVLIDAAWEAVDGSGDGGIALIDAAHLPAKFGLSWSAYAARGFSGLVVTHGSGLQALDWKEACGAAESQTPVCFPRVAATPAVLALAGSEVRLNVEVAWETVEHRALLARLKPTAGSTGQAVVISVPYDQVAALPDLTPSADQDLPLATALAAFRALAASREHLGRDILLVASAGGENGDDGIAWLLSAAGAQQGGATGREWWARRAAECSAREAVIGRLAEELRAPGLLRDADASEAALAGLADGASEVLAEIQRHVVNDRVAELNEVALQRRIAMLRAAPAPGAVPPAALLDAYIEAKQQAGKVSMIASWPLVNIVRRAAPAVAEHDLDGRLVRWLSEIAGRVRNERLQAEAAVRIGRMFAELTTVLVLEPRPVSATGAEMVAVHRGQEMMPGSSGLVFGELCQRLVAEAGSDAPTLNPMTGGQYAAQVDGAIMRLPLQAAAWSNMGYAAMALVHVDHGDSYRRLTAPDVVRTITPPRRFLRLTADLLGLLASGRGEVPMPPRANVRTWGGQVLASGIGAGLVPSHPLVDALVGVQVPDRPADFNLVGYGTCTTMVTDDRGYYGVPPGPFRIQPRWTPYKPVVARFDANGRLNWVRDSGNSAQALFRSDGYDWNPPQWINLVTFRADPVVISDRVDPRLLRPWAEIRPLTRDGLAAQASWAAWDGAGGLSVFFLPPDRFTVFTLNAGSPENPLVRSVRSVLLGVAVPAGTRLAEAQPDGIGYLPADHPWIIDTANQAAASLLRLDAPKLKQQVEQGLARPGMSEAAEAARMSLNAAAAATDTTLALTAARRAGALAQQNHERIQSSINQAVANIVWYLCLLVPFALFTEKLVVGSSDVRRQILWSGAIFLGAFSLLAVLHPAFPLLASPPMILLGFVIMLIALGVSGVFLGRFQENLKSLQASRGQVEGARVDVLGVTVTAFLLGLNGLSRRKVRTGLTSATLVLITFALICFAGIQKTKGVAVTSVGPAAYQGMLITDETRGQIEEDEVAALRTRYGKLHQVCERSVLVGTEDFTRQRGNPQLDLVRGEGDSRKVSRGTGALLWQHDEPLAGRLRLIAGKPWNGAAASAEAPMPVMISDTAAESLRIVPADLAAGAVAATLNGQAVMVTAVFASDSLAGLRDLDGRSPLPFDIEAMLTIRRSRTNTVIAYPDDPLLPADKMVILPRTGLTAPVPSSEKRLVSCAVALDKLAYREANELITDHQRLSGMPLAYGLDGTAFVGRPRQAGGFGSIDLLIPLLIAALTVLNTMRGSVYERRDEIAVFNAVGIAPRYIAAMFFAEALVYAVVGAVAGFLLSLLLGRGLALLGLDAGLKLDVASLAPVYASLALAAAVFLSTWFPARQAAEIAAPSDGSGWKMPEPEGDRMFIELPFVFDTRDRMGVLAFFTRWFRDHGEGGSGPFQAAAPALSAERVDGAAVPRLTTRIWLKPFDQGVTQELRIELRPDAHGEYLAHLTIERISGSKDAWLRLNRPFMGVLRRHFLYWRAVDPAMRDELFTEAGALLRAKAEEATHV